VRLLAFGARAARRLIYANRVDDGPLGSMFITPVMRADHFAFLVTGRTCRHRERGLAGMAKLFALRHMGLPVDMVTRKF
jgi:hypothetical protein